jgi:hypothetical protein
MLREWVRQQLELVWWDGFKTGLLAGIVAALFLFILLDLWRTRKS